MIISISLYLKILGNNIVIKINKLFLIFFLLPLVTYAATLQYNEFCMRSQYKDKEILSMQILDPNLLYKDYKENYKITDGQPWEGVENLWNDYILVKAGRKKKDYVRKWAEDKNRTINGVSWSGDNMIGAQSIDKTPGRLNFAFIADIEIFRIRANDFYRNKIRYICRNVIIGQGSYSQGLNGKTVNNWWVLSNIGGKNLRCIGPNGVYSTFALVYPDSKEQYENVINIKFLN